MAVPAIDKDVSGSSISSSDDVAPSQANATWIGLRASAGETEKPLSLRALPCLKEHMNATSFLNTPLLLPITERDFCFITRHCPTHSQWRRLTHQPLRYKFNLIQRKLAAEIPPHNNWCCRCDSAFYALFLTKKWVVENSSIFRFLHCSFFAGIHCLVATISVVYVLVLFRILCKLQDRTADKILLYDAKGLARQKHFWKGKQIHIPKRRLYETYFE
jgi:hypothetical protein